MLTLEDIFSEDSKEIEKLLKGDSEADDDALYQLAVSPPEQFALSLRALALEEFQRIAGYGDSVNVVIKNYSNTSEEGLTKLLVPVDGQWVKVPDLPPFMVEQRKEYEKFGLEDELDSSAFIYTTHEFFKAIKPETKFRIEIFSSRIRGLTTRAPQRLGRLIQILSHEFSVHAIAFMDAIDYFRKEKCPFKEALNHVKISSQQHADLKNCLDLVTRGKASGHPYAAIRTKFAAVCSEPERKFLRQDGNGFMESFGLTENVDHSRVISETGSTKELCAAVASAQPEPAF